MARVGMIGGSAVLNGRMWVPGGSRYETPGSPVKKKFNDVWNSNDGAHWTQHQGSSMGA